MTTWRGVTLDDRTAAMMDEVARLVPFYVDPSQGSWSGAAASAGTHSGCGAIDVTNLGAAQCDELVAQMRRVGFAAWHRTPEQSDWVRHVHGIAVQPGGKWDRGCLHASAHDQVVDLYEGRNGLAGNGPDDGPREHVGTTWETYEKQGDEDMTPDQAEALHECRRMLGVLLGWNAPTGPEATIGTQTHADQVLTNTAEARRMGGVLLAAIPPASGELPIPAQIYEQKGGRVDIRDVLLVLVLVLVVWLLVLAL